MNLNWKNMDIASWKKLDATWKRLTYTAGVAALTTFLGCWVLLAYGGGAQETNTPARSTMSDAHFAKKAAQGGMAEVKLGQLALKNGSSATVKKFGQRMIDDHTKANDQLKDTAAKENVSLPSGLNAKDQARYDSLAKLSGAAFDKAYAQDMVKDHEMDIAEFKEESQNGKDGAIKNFAVQTLPTLEDHLKDAKRMLDTVNSASARTSASHSR